MVNDHGICMIRQWGRYGVDTALVGVRLNFKYVMANEVLCQEEVSKFKLGVIVFRLADPPPKKKRLFNIIQVSSV